MPNLDHSPDRLSPKLWIVGLIIIVGFSRHLPLDYPSLFNFSPTLAIFMFCGAYMKGLFSWVAPIVAIFLSDLFLSSSYGINFLEPFMLATLASYIAIWILGRKLGNNKNAYCWTAGALGAAILFHVVTCAFAWMINPAYIKNFSGLIQATVLGEPGYAPAYLFLRNSILSTVFFGLCFRWIKITIFSESFTLRASTPATQR